MTVASADVHGTTRLVRVIAWTRLAAVPAALALVYAHRDELRSADEVAAWVACGVLSVEALALAGAVRRDRAHERSVRLDLVAVALDLAIVYAFVLIFAFEAGQPLRSLVFLVVIEGALRFGTRGGLAVGLLAVPLVIAAELLRVERFDFSFQTKAILLSSVLYLLIGLIVGRLTADLLAEGLRAAFRAGEAERLRDELGRRVDVLEATNRCARALASSLDLDEAFSAFIRELRGLVEFDRLAIVLAEGGEARVMATAGMGSERVLPPGTARPIAGSVIEEVLAGRLVYRKDMADLRYPEEEALLDLGLRSRVAAPLLLGPRAVGMLSLVRFRPQSFGADEIELVSLLGRLVATAVQNIRAYDAERSTVAELRRLSALRADFVSLVSHELRSPMASVIGSALTLQQRWRELSPEQRESFLALIVDETSRLSALISDVLDTSRIEAGTFSLSFTDVDVGRLAREAAATATIGQDEVAVSATVRDPIPPVRGDPERLRQVLTNLVENAVKYSPAGDEVTVTVYSRNGTVLVDVRDSGPGIALDQQELIFEKFGRARSSGGGKPGTGLGLFIARSITTAHGGSLDVRSTPQRGATFTLALPASDGDPRSRSAGGREPHPRDA